MSKYVWIEVVKGFVEVAINPLNFNDFKCNCKDTRHLYPNKFPNFRCRSYWIALEKFCRKMQEELKSSENSRLNTSEKPMDSCKSGQCSVEILKTTPNKVQSIATKNEKKEVNNGEERTGIS